MPTSPHSAGAAPLLSFSTKVPPRRKGGCPGRRPKTKKAAPPGAASERSLDYRRDDQLLRSSGTRSTVVVVVVPVWVMKQCTLIIALAAAPRIEGLLVGQAHIASIATKPPPVNPTHQKANTK